MFFRHLLITHQVLGNVPTIVFLKDEEEARRQEVLFCYSPQPVLAFKMTFITQTKLQLNVLIVFSNESVENEIRKGSDSYMEEVDSTEGRTCKKCFKKKYIIIFQKCAFFF